MKNVKVGLVVKPNTKASKKAGRKADEFETWLRERNVEVVRKKTNFNSYEYRDENRNYAPSDLFCIFVLGGDGTFLSAARWVGDQQIPILGVKFGEVGFLAETEGDALYSAAETILANRFTAESRMRLQVEVIRDGNSIVNASALNDVVISKSSIARLARINTYLDEDYLTTFKGDGLIISTPTGSTAYSLAAGGPIIHPSVPGIIMTPICPFTLTNRPLILPDTVCIKMKPADKTSEIMLTFDGQEGLDIHPKDTIIVRKSAWPISMITFPEQTYFDVLKTKLRWSGGRI